MQEMSPETKATVTNVSSGWIVDKRISLPTLLTLVGYALFSAWYVAKIDSRLTNAETAASEVKGMVIAADVKAQKAIDSQATYGERLARIETVVLGIDKKIDRLEEGNKR